MRIDVQRQEILVVPVVVAAAKRAQPVRHVAKQVSSARKAARSYQKVGVAHVVQRDVKIQTGTQELVCAGSVACVEPRVHVTHQHHLGIGGGESTKTPQFGGVILRGIHDNDFHMREESKGRGQPGRNGDTNVEPDFERREISAQDVTKMH